MKPNDPKSNMQNEDEQNLPISLQLGLKEIFDHQESDTKKIR